MEAHKLTEKLYSHCEITLFFIGVTESHYDSQCHCEGTQVIVKVHRIILWVTQSLLWHTGHCEGCHGVSKDHTKSCEGPMVIMIAHKLLFRAHIDSL